MAETTAGFTHCPACGFTSALAVRKCPHCGHDARSRRLSISSVLTGLLLAASLCLVLYMAWNRYLQPETPFIGAWSGDRVRFDFRPDHTVTTDAVFDSQGRLSVRTKPVYAHWSRAAELMTIRALGQPGKQGQPGAAVYNPPVTLHWDYDGDQDQLTLAGIGRDGTFVDTVSLHRASR